YGRGIRVGTVRAFDGARRAPGRHERRPAGHGVSPGRGRPTVAGAPGGDDQQGRGDAGAAGRAGPGHARRRAPGPAAPGTPPRAATALRPGADPGVAPEAERAPAGAREPRPAADAAGAGAARGEPG